MDPRGERPGAVEGAGEHLVARQPGHRHQLAGDRGLVDLARSRHQHRVRADALAGTHAHHVADVQVGRVDDLLGAVGTDAGGPFGSQVEQGVHGVGGPGGRDGLQRSRGGEDDDQQGAVEDLTDAGGAERGDDHQQVHVQDAATQRGQPGPRRLPAAGGTADQIQPPPHRPGRSRQVRGPAQQEQHDGQRRPAHLSQRAHGGGPSVGRVLALARGLPCHCRGRAGQERHSYQHTCEGMKIVN